MDSFLKTKSVTGKQLSNQNLIRRDSLLLSKQELPITTLLSRAERQPNAPNELSPERLLNDLATLQKIQKL